MAAMMLAEVGARNLIGISLQITWELSSYAMASAFLFGAAYAMHVGAHVRVSALLNALDPRSMRWLDGLVTVLALLVVGYVASSLFSLAWRSLSGDVRSWGGLRFPLVIPQALIALGALQLALQLVARLARLLLGLPAYAEPDAGTTTAEGRAEC
jgi:TRAP-type C4-dicarboxylate transport system permease small subunit